jgi:hypothetical protein
MARAKSQSQKPTVSTPTHPLNIFPFPVLVSAEIRFGLRLSLRVVGLARSFPACPQTAAALGAPQPAATNDSAHT